MAVLVKSSGHFSSSYISLQISQSSCVAFSPRLFNISDGISSTPAAFPSFISVIANNISLFNTSRPATSSSTSTHSSFVPKIEDFVSPLSLAFHLYHIKTQYIASLFHPSFLSYPLLSRIFLSYTSSHNLFVLSHYL